MLPAEVWNRCFEYSDPINLLNIRRLSSKMRLLFEATVIETMLDNYAASAAKKAMRCCDGTTIVVIREGAQKDELIIFRALKWLVGTEEDRNRLKDYLVRAIGHGIAGAVVLLWPKTWFFRWLIDPLKRKAWEQVQPDTSETMLVRGYNRFRQAFTVTVSSSWRDADDQAHSLGVVNGHLHQFLRTHSFFVGVDKCGSLWERVTTPTATPVNELAPHRIVHLDPVYNVSRPRGKGAQEQVDIMLVSGLNNHHYMKTAYSNVFAVKASMVVVVDSELYSFPSDMTLFAGEYFDEGKADEYHLNDMCNRIEVALPHMRITPFQFCSGGRIREVVLYDLGFLEEIGHRFGEESRIEHLVLEKLPKLQRIGRRFMIGSSIRKVWMCDLPRLRYIGPRAQFPKSPEHIFLRNVATVDVPALGFRYRMRKSSASFLEAGRKAGIEFEQQTQMPLPS